MVQIFDVFAQAEKELTDGGFQIVSKDDKRPWGGFLVIDESQAETFSTKYFKGMNVSEVIGAQKLSPKFLIVAPLARLSWQYHFRRAEIWSVFSGPVGVTLSDDNTEKAKKIYEKGDVIQIKQGERHRLIGEQNWGIVAEIWKHTDPGNPSNENDIVRIQDDYGR